jgi:Na+-transporting NADH:ubiquinone oxidoreductase subunit NqrF
VRHLPGKFLEGEPEEMTEAELMVLNMRDLVGEVKLSCQVDCDRDMLLRVPMTVSATEAGEPVIRPSARSRPRPSGWRGRHE